MLKWMPNVHDKIRIIAALQDDWDGDNSPALLPIMKENAMKFLHHIRNIEGLPEPEVCLISGGGLQIEWCVEGRELEVEFMRFDVIDYLKASPGFMTEDVFLPDDPKTACDIVTWLKGGE